MKSKITTILLALGALFSANATIHTILVGQGGGFTFSPSTLSVAVGDTVRFSWVNGFHTTVDTQIPTGALKWESAITDNVKQFDYKVTVAGNYQYKCGPHGSSGMTGSFSATVTGVNDQFTAIKSSFTLSPNPATEQANLQFSSQTDFKGYVRIFDAVGNLVKEEKIKVQVGENAISLNTSQLKAGLYYLNLFDKNDSFLAQKFIKQ